MEGVRWRKVMKIIFAGSTKGGKTSVISRYANDKFDESTSPTVGVEFTNKCVSSGKSMLMVQIWDLAGDDKFKAITTAYYKKTIGVVLVYDVTKKSTFEALKSLHTETTMQVEENSKYLLLGNKIDLEKEREVSTEEGSKYADEIGASFFEISAKEGKNIQKVLDSFFTDLYFATGCCCEM